MDVRQGRNIEELGMGMWEGGHKIQQSKLTSRESVDFYETTKTVNICFLPFARWECLTSFSLAQKSV